MMFRPFFVASLISLTSLVAILLISAPAAAEDSFTLETDDGQHSLTLQGRFQLRYVYAMPDGAPDHSSFFLRRLQPDLRGSFYDGLIQTRLMPDLSRTATLRDGWVSLRLTENFRLRAGQFTVPFNWERHAPPTRHLFVERSTANNAFEAPTGRDIGVMFHGVLGERFNLGVGVFSGQGINQPVSLSTGHLVSGRGVAAITGDLLLDETPLTVSEDLHINLAIGAYYAHRNSARQWYLWDESFPEAANTTAATTDLLVHLHRFTLHMALFVADVEPDDPDPEWSTYQGAGFTAHLAALLLPERLLIAARYSLAQPDLSRTEELRSEGVLGLTFLHRLHDSKLHLEALRQTHELPDGTAFSDQIRLQYQFLF